MKEGREINKTLLAGKEELFPGQQGRMKCYGFEGDSIWLMQRERWEETDQIRSQMGNKRPTTQVSAASLFKAPNCPPPAPSARLPSQLTGLSGFPSWETSPKKGTRPTETLDFLQRLWGCNVKSHLLLEFLQGWQTLLRSWGGNIQNWGRVKCMWKSMVSHFFIPIYFFKCYWNIVDWQCCVSFRYTAKWFLYIYRMYIYICMYIYIYRILFLYSLPL